MLETPYTLGGKFFEHHGVQCWRRIRTLGFAVVNLAAAIYGFAQGAWPFGLIETFSAVYVSSAYKDAIGMVLLIAILLFLPSGLVGLWKARS